MKTIYTVWWDIETYIGAYSSVESAFQGLVGWLERNNLGKGRHELFQLSSIAWTAKTQEGDMHGFINADTVDSVSAGAVSVSSEEATSSDSSIPRPESLISKSGNFRKADFKIWKFSKAIFKISELSYSVGRTWSAVQHCRFVHVNRPSPAILAVSLGYTCQTDRYYVVLL